MSTPKIFTMPMSQIYPAYVNKVTRKGRSVDDLNQIITWLTGYDDQTRQQQLDRQASLATFFDEAPAFNPRASKITGVVCGVRVETLSDPLMQKIRYLDKLVDELAQGRPLSKIYR